MKKIVLSLLLLFMMGTAVPFSDGYPPYDNPNFPFPGGGILYHGYLTDKSNNPITGTRSVTFNIYGQAGNLWRTETVSVNFVQGNFYHTLSVAGIDALGVPDIYSLGIKIGSDSEMQPRQRLDPFSVYAAYSMFASRAGRALNAGNADKLGDLTPDQFFRSSDFDTEFDSAFNSSISPLKSVICKYHPDEPICQ